MTLILSGQEVVFFPNELQRASSPEGGGRVTVMKMKPIIKVAVKSKTKLSAIIAAKSI